jgi:hypothetical protein
MRPNRRVACTAPMARLRFEPTPNANAYKVTVPSPFCNGSRIVSTPEKATTPVAKALISVPGVQSLFFLNDFVTVTKKPEADWDSILPLVKAALEKHPHFVA